MKKLLHKIISMLILKYVDINYEFKKRLKDNNNIIGDTYYSKTPIVLNTFPTKKDLNKIVDSIEISDEYELSEVTFVVVLKYTL